MTLPARLYASASYIAAPTAMRIVVPEVNPALSIGAALGITFRFSLIVGIPQPSLNRSQATFGPGDDSPGRR